VIVHHSRTCDLHKKTTNVFGEYFMYTNTESSTKVAPKKDKPQFGSGGKQDLSPTGGCRQYSHHNLHLHHDPIASTTATITT